MSNLLVAGQYGPGRNNEQPFCCGSNPITHDRRRHHHRPNHVNLRIHTFVDGTATDPIVIDISAPAHTQ
jgi:hypothetical protein